MLSKEQIEARMEMFEEAASHLEASVTDDKVEQEQAAKIVKIIRNLAKNWYGRIMEKRG